MRCASSKDLQKVDHEKHGWEKGVLDDQSARLLTAEVPDYYNEGPEQPGDRNYPK